MHMQSKDVHNNRKWPFMGILGGTVDAVFQHGGQKVSYTAIMLLILCWLTLIISLFVSVGGKLKWLDFLYVASYVKLAITLLKYIPQVSLLG